MKKILALALSLVMCISLVGCGNSNKAVVTVNGQEISVGNYEKILALNKSTMEAYYGSEIWSEEVEEGLTYEDTLKEMVLASMVTAEVIYLEAEKEGVAPTDEEVQEEIANFNESIVDDTDYQEQLKSIGIDDEFLKFQFARDLANLNLKAKYIDELDISDSELQTYYDENKDDFYTDTVTASHILISTQDDEGNELTGEDLEKAETEAKEVLAKVNAGEDFAELAKEYSDDPGSAESGGELSTFGRDNNLVEEFSNASFELKTGEVSELVKTDYGYHIIKCTERIDKQESFDDVKDNIKSTLGLEKYAEYIEGLEADATITQDENVVKKAKF